MIEDKIMCLGVRLQEYYCICAIVGLARRILMSEDTKREERIASDRISQMIRKILGMQDNYTAATTLASLPNMVYCPILRQL